MWPYSRVQGLSLLSMVFYGTDCWVLSEAFSILFSRNPRALKSAWPPSLCLSLSPAAASLFQASQSLLWACAAQAAANGLRHNGTILMPTVQLLLSVTCSTNFSPDLQHLPPHINNTIALWEAPDAPFAFRKYPLVSLSFKVIVFHCMLPNALKLLPTYFAQHYICSCQKSKVNIRTSSARRRSL